MQQATDEVWKRKRFNAVNMSLIDTATRGHGAVKAGGLEVLRFHKTQSDSTEGVTDALFTVVVGRSQRIIVLMFSWSNRKLKNSSLFFVSLCQRLID